MQEVLWGRKNIWFQIVVNRIPKTAPFSAVNPTVFLKLLQIHNCSFAGLLRPCITAFIFKYSCYTFFLCTYYSHFTLLVVDTLISFCKSWSEYVASRRKLKQIACGFALASSRLSFLAPDKTEMEKQPLLQKYECATENRTASLSLPSLRKTSSPISATSIGGKRHKVQSACICILH